MQMKTNVVIRGEPSRLGVTAHLPTNALCTAVGSNPGNLAFSYATALILGFPANYKYYEPIKCDENIAVFSLANFLGPHVDPKEFSEFIKKAPPAWKLVVTGLGTQGPLDRLSFDPDDVGIKESHIEWVQLIRARSPSIKPSIALRGQYTYNVLRKYGLEDGAVVIGCPSFMLSPLKNLGQLIYKKFTSIGNQLLLDGALGNPWDPKHRAFEQGLLRLAISTTGVMHVQMMEDHIALARGDNLDEEKIVTLQRQMVPHLLPKDLRDFARRHLRVWWDIPSWMEYLSRADFLFGSRIHGVMLALQAGVPAMCAVWDSRTHELCETMGVPFVSLYDEPWASGKFNFQDIHNEFNKQFNPEEFDILRRNRAMQFVEFFSQNGVQVSQHLLTLAN